jgi:hypothetical protein
VIRRRSGGTGSPTLLSPADGAGSVSDGEDELAQDGGGHSVDGGDTGGEGEEGGADLGVDEVGDLLEEFQHLEAHGAPGEGAECLSFGEGEDEGADAEG